MNTLDGWKTLILGVMQFGAGGYFVATGVPEAGYAFIASGAATLGVRHTTTGPAAWRQPPKRKTKAPTPGDSA